MESKMDCFTNTRNDYNMINYRAITNSYIRHCEAKPKQSMERKAKNTKLNNAAIESNRFYNSSQFVIARKPKADEAIHKNKRLKGT